jgi:hypothetical protein
MNTSLKGLPRQIAPTLIECNVDMGNVRFSGMAWNVSLQSDVLIKASSPHASPAIAPPQDEAPKNKEMIGPPC